MDYFNAHCSTSIRKNGVIQMKIIVFSHLRVYLYKYYCEF